MECNRDYYNNKYGVVPEFRAAVHFGDVISAQIGDIKREIIYNGDVLNTTARIIEQCKIYREDLIVSGDIMANIGDDPDYVNESLGTVILRGKEQPVVIFGIQRRQELFTNTKNSNV